MERSCDFLEFKVVPGLSGRVEVLVSNFIDGIAGAVWCGNGGNLWTGEIGFCKEGIDGGFLSEVSGDVVVWMPDGLESNAEEVGNVTFEGSGDFAAEFLFE